MPKQNEEQEKSEDPPSTSGGSPIPVAETINSLKNEETDHQPLENKIDTNENETKTPVQKEEPKPNSVNTPNINNEKREHETPIKTTPISTGSTSSTPRSRPTSVSSEDGAAVLEGKSKEELIELFLKQRQATLRYRSRFTEVHVHVHLLHVHVRLLHVHVHVYRCTCRVY